MSDERLVELASLALSIPTPKEKTPPEITLLVPNVTEGKLKDRAKMKAIMEQDELDEEVIKRHIQEEEQSSEDVTEEEEEDNGELLGTI